MRAGVGVGVTVRTGVGVADGVATGVATVAREICAIAEASDVVQPRER